jgi:pimeloyl-[acyl-carrier protein] methyl ester esterase
MSLHRDVLGAGPEVALLHDWGMHSGLFGTLAATLSRQCRVHLLDLPGHGRSPWSKGSGDLEGIARQVALHLPQRCQLVGWSLGGLVGIRLATLFPERFDRLALIATTPCAIQRRGWAHGMDEATLTGLTRRLGRDWKAAIQEYIGLAVRGDVYALEALREYRRLLFEHGDPSSTALAAGLEILRAVDLRAELPQVMARTLAISGDEDRLAPPPSVAALVSLIPGARHARIPHAAHAPFLSHRAEVEALLTDFLGAP